MPTTAATAKKSPATNPGPAVLTAGPAPSSAPRPIAGDAAQIRAEHDYCERRQMPTQAAQPPPVAVAQPTVVVALR
ncbi:hypothetical protein PRIPAC_90546 [Pristionchus pacificus]|uniref:Uncharacterized protein n=1 Tax=Pristionchus pacificus TaxID=54126 RepID=A0A2A6B3W3_PRIPA|nr:hypothetical protein PRIPAC_90546 [Pristionchus pacificus]|eukprot:PDM60569.1 hypothetical protein PRIPAC_53547 [Pristionchus pacificus]